jgi:transcriptional regulator with XRE-family HTH domain
MEAKTLHLGQNLKKAIKTSKMSQVEFSNKSGIKRDRLNKLFLKDDMKVKTLMLAAETLGVPYYSFFDDEDYQGKELLKKRLQQQKQFYNDLQNLIKFMEERMVFFLNTLYKGESEIPEMMPQMELINPDGTQKKVSIFYVFDAIVTTTVPTRTNSKSYNEYINALNIVVNTIENRQQFMGLGSKVPKAIFQFYKVLMRNNNPFGYIPVDELMKNPKKLFEKSRKA